MNDERDAARMVSDEYSGAIAEAAKDYLASLAAARLAGARAMQEAVIEWFRARGQHDLAASVSGESMLGGALVPEDVVKEADRG